MIADVIEIIQVNLLFADDRFKQFGGQDIAVVHTDFAKLVVHEDGVVFTVAVAAVNRFDFLPLDHLPGNFGSRLAAEFFDALGEHFAVAHFIDGDEFHIRGQFAIVHVVQVVMLVHVLMNRM